MSAGKVARIPGVAGYPGEGVNRWAAVHRSDAARLAALALEKAPAGARVHAVAEEGIPTREIAEAIGRALDLPVTSIAAGDVAEHFGWIGAFFAMGLQATSTATRELLGWTPTGPTLIEDLDSGAYSLVEAGVKVNALAPGLRATELNSFATANGGDPAEAAAGAVRLALLGDDGPTGGFFSWDGTTVPW